MEEVEERTLLAQADQVGQQGLLMTINKEFNMETDNLLYLIPKYYRPQFSLPQRPRSFQHQLHPQRCFVPPIASRTQTVPPPTLQRAVFQLAAEILCILTLYAVDIQVWVHAVGIRISVWYQRMESRLHSMTIVADCYAPR